jgi:nucleoside 2-deoxyribosyltransferase
VANYDKKGISGYIGGNTFLEMGYAFVLGKPIFLLNKIPDISYTSEIEGMDPIVIYNNLEKIKGYYSL